MEGKSEGKILSYFGDLKSSTAAPMMRFERGVQLCHCTPSRPTPTMKVLGFRASTHECEPPSTVGSIDQLRKPACSA